jgi:hypothetical protein
MRIAGHRHAVAVDDADHEHHARRQQAFAAQFRQGAQRALAFDRVLQHAQGLVDAIQAARHLRFVGAQHFLQRVGGGFLRVFALGVDLVESHHPDRHQQQQGKQRQRNVGVQAAPQPARAQRFFGRGHGVTCMALTLASSAARSM